MQEDFEHFNWEDLFKDQFENNSLNSNIQSNSTFNTFSTKCIRVNTSRKPGHSTTGGCGPVVWESLPSPDRPSSITHQDSTSSLPEFPEHECFVDGMIDTEFKLPEIEKEELKDDDLFEKMADIFENEDFKTETDFEKMEEVVHFYNEFFCDVNSSGIEAEACSTNNDNFVLNTLDVDINNTSGVVCGQSCVLVVNDGNVAFDLNDNTQINNISNNKNDLITTPNNNKVKIVKQNNISNVIKKNNSGSKPNLRRKFPDCYEDEEEKERQEYLEKRFRNNQSVRKSRMKSKKRQLEVEERMKTLEQENEELKRKVSAMETEASILKKLLSEVVNK